MASSASAGLLAITDPVNFADLPANPKLGYIALVGDGTATVVGAVANGSGSAKVLVWYNGTAWRIIGGLTT